MKLGGRLIPSPMGLPEDRVFDPKDVKSAAPLVALKLQRAFNVLAGPPRMSRARLDRFVFPSWLFESRGLGIRNVVNLLPLDLFAPGFCF